MPYIFQIQTDEFVYVPDGCGESVWIHKDGDGAPVLVNNEDMEDAIEQHWEMETKEEFKERLSKLLEEEGELEWLILLTIPSGHHTFHLKLQYFSYFTYKLSSGVNLISVAVPLMYALSSFMSMVIHPFRS